MKPQCSTSTQAQKCCQDTDDHATFEKWLDSPEGRAWLDGNEEREGMTRWNDDGFNPENRRHA